LVKEKNARFTIYTNIAQKIGELQAYKKRKRKKLFWFSEQLTDYVDRDFGNI
jgi:hypothetical protein